MAGSQPFWPWPCSPTRTPTHSRHSSRYANAHLVCRAPVKFKILTQLIYWSYVDIPVGHHIRTVLWHCVSTRGAEPRWTWPIRTDDNDPESSCIPYGEQCQWWHGNEIIHCQWWTDQWSKWIQRERPVEPLKIEWSVVWLVIKGLEYIAEIAQSNLSFTILFWFSFEVEMKNDLG